jgi:DNA-binding NtrC family response regulator
VILRALKRSKGNKAKAARLLGMTRPRLYRRIIQLGLE